MAAGDKFYLGSQKAFPNYYSYNASIGTTEVNVSLGFTTNCIKYISNDDETNSLHVCFGNVPAWGTPSGMNTVITLKPGEVINELNVAVSRINFKRTAGSGNVRFVGV